MGIETLFEHEEILECDNGHPVTVRFLIWEYPLDVTNCTEIECDGGEVIEEFDFSDTLPVFVPEDDDDDICQCCGKRGPIDTMGLCPECSMREYKAIKNKDIQ